MQRIPSLDGLRAVSVALVIFSHLTGYRTGAVGVRIFFVISGFLITNLLEKERERSGTISLKNFYARRSLRIFPLAYTYMGIMAILWAAGFINTTAGDFLAAATYTSSYRLSRSFYLDHLWSLSVEEQFYLLWPMIVLLAGKNARRIALVAFLIGPVLRIAWWFCFHSRTGMIGQVFPTVEDSLAIGCWAALAGDSFTTRISRIPSFVFPLLPLAAVGLDTLPEVLTGPARHFFMPFLDTAMGVLLVILVAGSAHRKFAILNLQSMVYIGTLSYALYIWQQPFMHINASVPVKLACIFAAAVASHYLVERPFLRLKDRFALKSTAAAA